MPTIDYSILASDLRGWARELGFQQVGISGTKLDDDEAHLLNWLKAGRHGEMDYMARHGSKRSHPAELLPGTLRVISVRMDYLPARARDGWEVLKEANPGLVMLRVSGYGQTGPYRRRPGFAHIAHLIPENPEGRYWQTLAPQRPAELDLDFTAFIAALEGEFAGRQQTRKVEAVDRAILVRVETKPYFDSEASLAEALFVLRNGRCSGAAAAQAEVQARFRERVREIPTDGWRQTLNAW